MEMYNSRDVYNKDLLSYLEDTQENPSQKESRTYHRRDHWIQSQYHVMNK